MAQLNFDANNVAPREAFDVLPNGWYHCTITGADMTPTKAGDAEYLKIELEVDGNKHPQFASRKVWDRLNLNHEKQQTREIAQRTLSAICHAIGKLRITDTEELLGGQLVAKVVARAAKDGFDASNDVKGYKSVADAPAAPAAPAATAAPAAGRTGGWKR